MKRAVAAALGLLACASTAIGQGHILIWSYYVAPYNQILWDADTPINDTSVQLTIQYGAGSISDPGLLDQEGLTFTVNPRLSYRGGGYYDPQYLTTPTEGLYTFMIVAQWEFAHARSALYEVTTGPERNPADTAPVSPGIIFVPEPSSFALLGLGAAALFVLRKRE